MVTYGKVTWSQKWTPTKEQISSSKRRRRGGSSSKRPPAKTMTKEQYNKVFSDYRSGKLTQAQAIGSLRGTKAQQDFERDQAALQVRREELAAQYQQRRIQPAAQETPATPTGLIGKYKQLESEASKKVYGFFGFSPAQSELQRQRVLESERLLKGVVTKEEAAFRQLGYPEPLIKLYAGPQRALIKAGTLISGATGTIAKETLDKPITTPTKYVALGVAGYGAGLLLSGAGAIFGPTGVIAGTGATGQVVSAVATGAAKVVGAGLGGLFVYKTGKDIADAPTSFEQGGVIGKTVLETAAIGGGFISGKERAAKIGDWWRTRGRTEIPVEDIVIKDVLTGKRRFVDSSSYGYRGPKGKAKQSFDIKVFREKPYAYHVTPDKYWVKDPKYNGVGFTTRKGTSEFHGLYVAPSPSTRFAKIGKPNIGYNIKLLGWGDGKSGKPAVAQVFTKFGTKRFGGGKRVITKGGTAWVTGVKPEIEAVIPVGKMFTKTGGSEYFKFGGRRFPIDIFKPTKTKGVKDVALGLVSGATKSIGSSSVYTKPTYSLYSPVTAAITSIFGTSEPSTKYSSGTIAPQTYGYGSIDPGKETSGPAPYEDFIRVTVSDTSRGGGGGGGSGVPSSPPSEPPSTPTDTYPTYSPPSRLVPRTSTSDTGKELLSMLLPRFKAKPTKKAKSYTPQVMYKGKWKTVGKRMTRIGALSRAGKGADNTTSRRIRIVPSKKKVQIKGGGDWNVRKYKFRPYVKRRGRKIATPNQFIEKRTFAIDSIGEKTGLSIAKYSKNMGWLVSNKKSKKKNRGKRKSQWLF